MSEITPIAIRDDKIVNASLPEWIEERCILDPYAIAPVVDLVDDWKRWFGQRTEWPRNSAVPTRAFKRCLLRAIGGGRIPPGTFVKLHYRGIALRSAPAHRVAILRIELRIPRALRGAYETLGGDEWLLAQLHNAPLWQ